MTQLTRKARSMTLYNVENYKLLEATSVNYNTNLNSIFIFFIWIQSFLFIGSVFMSLFLEFRAGKKWFPKVSRCRLYPPVPCCHQYTCYCSSTMFAGYWSKNTLIIITATTISTSSKSIEYYIDSLVTQ